MRLHLDLTSGIGGFALAARWNGVQTIGFCEIDPWCRRVLAKNFPGVPQHDDVKTITPAILADWSGGQRVWILTAGYPCQPFSVAGQRRGETDPRHLWPFIAALVADVRPTWLLLENVAGHISLGLDSVLDALENLNYACWPLVVPAAGVGAPHQRKRVWIVACDQRHVVDTDSIYRNERLCVDREHGESRGTQCRSWRESTKPNGGADVADAACWQDDGRRRIGLDDSQAAWGRVDAAAGVGGQVGPAARRLEAVGSLGNASHGVSGWMVGPGRINPWRGNWEDGTPRVVEQEPDRIHKLRALGNAVVPQIPAEIIRAMIVAEHS